MDVVRNQGIFYHIPSKLTQGQSHLSLFNETLFFVSLVVYSLNIIQQKLMIYSDVNNILY